MEISQQGVYDRRLNQIAIEQNEALENVFFQLKKMRFINAVKGGGNHDYYAGRPSKECYELEVDRPCFSFR